MELWKIALLTGLLSACVVDACKSQTAVLPRNTPPTDDDRKVILTAIKPVISVLFNLNYLDEDRITFKIVSSDVDHLVDVYLHISNLTLEERTAKTARIKVWDTEQNELERKNCIKAINTFLNFVVQGGFQFKTHYYRAAVFPGQKEDTFDMHINVGPRNDAKNLRDGFIILYKTPINT